MTHELSTLKYPPISLDAQDLLNRQAFLHSQILDSMRTHDVSESTRLMEHKHRYALVNVGAWAYMFMCGCGEYQLVDKFKFRMSCRGELQGIRDCC